MLDLACSRGTWVACMIARAGRGRRALRRNRCWRRSMLALAVAAHAAAQDMLRFLDLKSGRFHQGRHDAGRSGGARRRRSDQLVDLSGKRLNGLDSSGLDLRRAMLQAARLNPRLARRQSRRRHAGSGLSARRRSQRRQPALAQARSPASSSARSSTAPTGYAPASPPTCRRAAACGRHASTGPISPPTCAASPWG